MTPKKILVPLDGSRLAEAAFDEAVDVAKRHDATVVLLRAAQATRLPAADPTETQVAVVREAETYLAGIAERARNAGLTKVETSVWYAPAAEAIIEAARVRGIDLIVMGTHGRSGLGRFVLGSVAESVLRGTTTPILMLRDHSAATPAAGAEASSTHETTHV